MLLSPLRILYIITVLVATALPGWLPEPTLRDQQWSVILLWNVVMLLGALLHRGHVDRSWRRPTLVGMAAVLYALAVATGLVCPQGPRIARVVEFALGVATGTVFMLLSDVPPPVIKPPIAGQQARAGMNDLGQM